MHKRAASISHQLEGLHPGPEISGLIRPAGTPNTSDADVFPPLRAHAAESSSSFLPYITEDIAFEEEYEEYLSDLGWSDSQSTSSGYTGGSRFIEDPEAQLNHIYIGFEGVGILDPDVYDLATMQVLLGGGGSFSAGGPGKGMYSRLYTHILNHHTLVDHCASFNHIYVDSSLFGLFASYFPDGAARKGGVPHILPHLVHQLSLLLYRAVPGAELQRAKNQLKSSLIMALESRSVEVEDLGRQVCFTRSILSNKYLTIM